MNQNGLALCSRFAYPPNSLSLCGPDKTNDLSWYTETQKADKGTAEILSQFSTLYPYLELIASENGLSDPFLPEVVEAYWLGNQLLKNISARNLAEHLKYKIGLKKILRIGKLNPLLEKLGDASLPNHSFHVLNIYKRTGHLDTNHTVETMDACIISWGKIKRINKNSAVVDTAPLKSINGKLYFGLPLERTLMTQGEQDILFPKLKKDDWISYHWGYFCQKLTNMQLRNLIYYTNLSVKFANQK